MRHSGYTIQNALLSVADKTGIVEFAQQLQTCGIRLLATGNTAKLLQEHGLQVTEVADYTQFPEIMGGRVKTLHPKIHGGILARRDQDMDVLKQHSIDPIDLVVINLYPFAKTIQKPDCTLAQAIEQIDIGGPSMLRGAAKNYAAVTVVIDPNDYANVLEEIQSQERIVSLTTRQRLAQKVFAHTAQYDQLIASYLEKQMESEIKQTLPETISLNLHKTQDLRYGENPQQAAAFYSVKQEKTPWQLRQGKPLSFNNLVDADVAWCCVSAFKQNPACVIVKHANPCGVANAHNLPDAYDKAYATDPTSAFGGIIAFNQNVDEKTISYIVERQFFEVIIAPEFTEDALKVLSKKPNVRALAVTHNAKMGLPYDIKCISSGLLIQELDDAEFNHDACSIVTQRKPTPSEWTDLIFAWHVAKYVKSNAIVYAKTEQTIGIGAGQTSRVSSAELGILKAQQAGLSVTGSVVASDAFYPFRDGVDAAAKAGVSAIIQPGGSMRDAEVIAAADEHGLAMVFTGVRHFKH